MSAEWSFTFKHFKFPLLSLLTHTAMIVSHNNEGGSSLNWCLNNRDYFSLVFSVTLWLELFFVKDGFPNRKLDEKKEHQTNQESFARTTFLTNLFFSCFDNSARTLVNVLDSCELNKLCFNGFVLRDLYILLSLPLSTPIGAQIKYFWLKEEDPQEEEPTYM